MQENYSVGEFELSIGFPSNGTGTLLTTTNTHKYLRFKNEQNRSLIKKLTTEIINFYFKTNKTSKVLESENRIINIHWGKNNVQSNQISYKIIERRFFDFGRFDTEYFKIYPYECSWLDSGLELSINWHKFDENSLEGLFVQDGTVKQQFSVNFPLTPKLNKEGIMLSNFQPFLIKKIISNRNELVQESEKALTFEWLYKLKSLINDTISLLDITLNQIYLKAEYNPLQGWKFDKEKLGERNGRRLNDKLKWIHQITGNELNIESYKESLNNLREIRNHLNHFDPPTIAFHIEEVAQWLNHIIDIAHIIYMIRKAINVQTSSNLMELLLQKKVEFIPEIAFSNRLPNKKEYGYQSSIWQQ